MALPAPDSGPPAPARRSIDVRGIPGWFAPVDQSVFGHVLGRQDAEPPGTLVELGAYLGKSAVVIGDHLREGEELVVVDLFGDAAPDPDNAQENLDSYATLTRREFEANYLRVHGRLPTVVQAPTTEVIEHVAPDSARFVHVDASHLYEHVRGDIEAAQVVLRPGGVVVCDDYRSPHTPGVAAAVWFSVHSGALRPFCLTPSKLYACFDDPAPHREAVLQWLASMPGLGHEVQRIAGEDVARIWPRKQRPPAPQDPVEAVAGKVDAVLGRLERVDARLARLERRRRKRQPGRRRSGRAVAAPSAGRRLVRALLPVRVRRRLRRLLA